MLNKLQIAEDAGAVAVMVLDKLHDDVRKLEVSLELLA